MGDIRVICESTSERKKKAKKNFEKIKPYLDDGMIYTRACYEAGITKRLHEGWRRYAWFKDIVEYGETQGYDFKTYSGKGRRTTR